MTSALNYATNATDFDFPEYFGTPSCPFVIASSSRSGSNMLQRALWRTGRAGAPEEYFTPKYVDDFSRRLPPGALTASGRFDPRAYARLLMRWRTSPNGAFGVKLHGDHLNLPSLGGLELDSLLEGPRYLWLRRENRVRQAISYALAIQTGVWILDGVWLPDASPNPDPPVYRHETILNCIRAIKREEDAWADYFRRLEVQPYNVFYENLVADYQSAMGQCFTYLGLDAPQHFSEPGIRAQSDAINDEWYARFMAEGASEKERRADQDALWHSCGEPTARVRPRRA